MKYVKRFSLWILISLFLGALYYATGAFWHWNLNPAEWSTCTRVLAGLAELGSIIVGFFIALDP